jgi:CubicO group peptidase (beta-lactamase class C family)
VLGHLIAQGTGKPLFQYAREKLFEPLGITEVQWVGGTDGEVSAASGLRMRPRDFAKIGQLVLDKGRWQGRQVVPAGWLEQILTPRAPVPAQTVGGQEGVEYGYQWWVIGRSTPNPWFAALGHGGQSLLIVPSLDLVVAVMAGNYNMPSQRAASLTIMKSIVLPSLKVN